MSFAKLNRVHFLVGANTDEREIFVNPQLRESILCHMVSDKGKLLELDDINMSNEDVLKVLGFASDHLVDFMMTAMEKATTLNENYKPRAEALAKVMSGSTSINAGLQS